MSTEKVLYEELRPEEFVERINKCPIAYLPLGTLEWHGMHMPYGADGLQSQGIFKQIAAKIGGIVLPMMFLGPDRAENIGGFDYYGMDNYGFEDGKPQQLEGSVYYVEDELFAAMLDRIIMNLKRAGFKAVIGHGHGPSMDAFINAHDRFEEKYGIPTYTLKTLGYEGEEGLMTDHAAFNETTLVMALRPELVDMNEIADDDIPVALWGVDPRGKASEAEGKRIIAKNMEKICATLAQIAATLPCPNRKNDYHNVQDMTR